MKESKEGQRVCVLRVLSSSFDCKCISACLSLSLSVRTSMREIKIEFQFVLNYCQGFCNPPYVPMLHCCGSAAQSSAVRHLCAHSQWTMHNNQCRLRPITFNLHQLTTQIGKSHCARIKSHCPHFCIHNCGI